MFNVSPFGEPLADEEPLWRYLDVGRFLHLLSQQALYFSRLDTLRRARGGDAWEGELPRLVRIDVEQFGRGMDEAYGVWTRRGAVSCWHNNSVESCAMWKLYTTGSEGVAFKTSAGRLREVMSGSRTSPPRSQAAYLGKVKYLDHDTEDHPVSSANRTTEHIFSKRRSFSHEQEVRAMVVVEESQLGLSVEVDLARLIERIVVSPEYPAWAIGDLQRIVNWEGLTVHVEKSDILQEPARLKEGLISANPTSALPRK